ncbi:MAG TPA: NAD(+) diphosphatase [Longimicrobium sp.]
MGSESGLAGQRPHVFAAGGVDRAGERRKDADWIAARMRDPRTRFAPVWEHRNLFVADEAAPRAAWLTPGEAAPLVDAAGYAVLLGVADDAAYFSFPLDEERADDPAIASAGEWGDLRRFGLGMESAEAGLLAFARGMGHWHARHRFCGVCGAPAEVREAGHLRACTGCGTHHFPRTDPAVIMRVQHGERCLLGRQHVWEPGVYSVLAGFVEPGESLEDAVAREVMEESGVAITDVRYHSSQPWPFPGSLMIGFTAEALTDEIRIEDEMEEVRWFTRDEVHRGLANGTFRFPSNYSISYRLVMDWLEG